MYVQGIHFLSLSKNIWLRLNGVCGWEQRQPNARTNTNETYLWTLHKCQHMKSAKQHAVKWESFWKRQQQTDEVIMSFSFFFFCKRHVWRATRVTADEKNTLQTAHMGMKASWLGRGFHSEMSKSVCNRLTASQSETKETLVFISWQWSKTLSGIHWNFSYMWRSLKIFGEVVNVCARQKRSISELEVIWRTSRLNIQKVCANCKICNPAHCKVLTKWHSKALFT